MAVSWSSGFCWKGYEFWQNPYIFNPETQSLAVLWLLSFRLRGMISEGVRPPTGQPSGSSSPLCASRTSFIKWQLGVYLTPLPNFLSGVTCSKTYLPDKYVVIFSALMNIYPLFFMHWPIISHPKQLRPNTSHTSEILLFGKVSMIHPLHIVWYFWGQQGSRAASWAHLHFHSKVENGHS